MATFRTYDRFLYATVETSEGVAASVNTTTDYIETIEPTFTITNRVYDRNVTNASMTQAPKHVTGTGRGGDGDGAPSAQCEFSFGVEMAGAGTAATLPIEPRWAKLLAACGLHQVTAGRFTLDSTQAIAPWSAAALSTGDWPPVVADAINTVTPWQFRHGEFFSNGTTPVTYAYNSAAVCGRLVGDVWYKDAYAYYVSGSAHATVPAVGTAIASGQYLFGQATDAFVQSGAIPVSKLAMKTGSTGVVDKAYTFSPASNELVGGTGAGSLQNSLTMRMYLSDTGEFLEMCGARGNVEFVFASGDRCIMQFTFTGALTAYDDQITVPPTANAQVLEVAPSVTGISMSLAESAAGASNAAYYDDTIFSEFSFNIGNEVVLREDLSSATGYDAAYISGRSPQITFNPDAKRQTGTYDFWDRLLSGECTHMEWVLGSTAGNHFRFKVPGAQFDQIGDGNRDNVMVFDSTVNCTGGNNGSSVLESADIDTPFGAGLTTPYSQTSTVMNERLGRENEFLITIE